MAGDHRNEERHPDANHDTNGKRAQHMVAVKPPFELLQEVGKARISQEEDNLA